MSRSIADALVKARAALPAFDLTPYLNAAAVHDTRAHVPKDKGLKEPISRQATPIGFYSQALARSKSTKRFAQAGLTPCEIARVRRLP
jgi:hypothetical protein